MKEDSVPRLGGSSDEAFSDANIGESLKRSVDISGRMVRANLEANLLVAFRHHRVGEAGRENSPFAQM